MARPSGYYVGGNTIVAGRLGGGATRRRRGPEGPWMAILRWAPHVGAVVAVVGAVLAVLAGLGFRFGWWELRSVSFVMLRWGAIVALIGAAVSLIGLIVAWPGRGRAGFALALGGLVLGLITFGIPYHQLQVVYALPFIHDITTDTENPPQFVALAEVKSGTENGVEYGGPEVADQQRAAYPDLAPMVFDAPPDEVFPQAVTAARRMGWEIAAIVPAEGRIEATDTTFWFGFKDDVVIRVQPLNAGGDEAAEGEAAGDEAAPAQDNPSDEGESLVEPLDEATRVDIRSMSRVGKSDVGANARRIRGYMQQLSALMR